MTDLHAKGGRRRTRVASCLALLLVATVLSVLSPTPRMLTGGRPVDVAYAAPKEDCDLDGYDDHTGAPLPWAGFDETRGDTIPPGWDGVANSWTGEHTNDDSGSGSTGGSGGSGGSSPGGSGPATPPKRSGTTGSTAPRPRSSATSATTRVTTSPAKGAAAPPTPKAAAGEATRPASTVAATAVDIPQVSPVDRETILGTRGVLEVSDSNGALIHADGSLRITGTGFAAGVEGLELWFDEADQRLGTVTTDRDGGFVLTVAVPSGIQAGLHSVYVGYKRAHIAHQAITVGPKTADTFAKALLVGFTSDNPDRDAGLGILAALGLAGALTWTSASVRGRLASRPNGGAGSG